MTQYGYILILLLLSQTVTGNDRAVTIALSNNNASISSIQKITGQAITDGVIDTLIINEGPHQASHQFLACAQASASSSDSQFNDFVNNLQRIPLNATGYYQLTTQASCGKSEEQFCFANPLACFNHDFISSKTAYIDTVAKAQVAASLADISIGKLWLDIHLNQGQIISTVDELGLPLATKNCSTIMADTDPANKIGTIRCLIRGNRLIEGHSIALVRILNKTWQCITDVAPKYAGVCKSY